MYGIVKPTEQEKQRLFPSGTDPSNKFIDRWTFHPGRCVHFSEDKNNLLERVKTVDSHYVALVNTAFDCVNDLEKDTKFEEGVGRYINTRLSKQFETKIAPFNILRRLTGTEVFDDWISGTAWTYFIETKYNMAVGVRAFVRDHAICMESFMAGTDGTFRVFQGLETPSNYVQDFYKVVERVLFGLIETAEYYHSKQVFKPLPKVAEIPSPSKQNVTFGLDYDGTVTSDYHGFIALVELLRNRGHKVYVVTMRYESECRQDKDFMHFTTLVDGYIPTGRQAKRDAVKLSGVNVHIWIDDNPQAVDMSASQIWGTPSPEGTIVIEEHGTTAVN